MEHEFYTGISLAIMSVYAVKKLGPAVAKYLDAEVEVKMFSFHLKKLNTNAIKSFLVHFDFLRNYFDFFINLFLIE